MIKYKKLLICFTFILFVLPVIVTISGLKLGTAHALEVTYPTILGLSITPGSSIIQYASYFFNFGMYIGGILALLVTTIGGVYYLASFSRGKFTGEGKEWIAAGIKGLLILMCAYLIAYTINPDLVVFKLGNLFSVQFNGGTDPYTIPSDVTVISYQEIPLGVLTETLMSKTAFCYNFDPDGNPLSAPLETDEDGKVDGPILRNHDRVDCLAKLMEAASKKAKIMADLAAEIKKLMETCTCAGKCEDPCNKNGDGCVVQGRGCGGACSVGAACAQPKNSESCCTPEVKEKIEHGKIKLGGSQGGQCAGPEKEYKGLDEFRCPASTWQISQCSGLAAILEKKVQVEKEEVAIIDKEKWKKLSLVQQLTYFKEKIVEMQSAIKADLNKLDSARAAVASCYNIKSSSDFIKIKESVKKDEKKIILSQKYNGVDSSKYCKGFNYSNSSCYKQCSNMCPDNTQQVVQCYSKCTDNKCDPDDDACLMKKTDCIRKCYNARPCPYYKEGKAGTFEGCISVCRQNCTNMCSKTYLDCSDDFKLCQQQCNNNSKCIFDNAGTCLFNSQVINTDDFKKCLTQDSDANIKNCIDNSYLCKYGSNENAGYPDCTTGYTGCAPSLQYLQNPKYSSPYIFENKEKQRCVDPYTACEEGKNKGQGCLDIYPENTKCPSASDCPDCPCGDVNIDLKFKIYIPGSGSASSSGGGYSINTPVPNDSNINLATKTSNTFTFGTAGITQSPFLLAQFLPPGICNCGPGIPPSSVCCDDGSSSGSSSSSSSGGSNSSSSSSSGGSGGGGTSITVPVKVSGYDLVTGECNEFTYSSDPLTFYCETPFAQSKNITGEYFKCSQSDEIPVGQAVDDAKKWAVDLLNTADSYVRSISSMMDTIKKISDKKPKEYCRCDSKYDTGKPICTSNCQYHAPRTVTSTDPDTGEETTTTIPPSCSLIACNGNSCQQMINYMTQLINDYVTMKKAFINITISLLKDGRTDPLKELTYSRDMMDSCGRQTTQRGIDYAKTLSCTIAYPSTGFLNQRCYGILNGVVQRPSIDSTDNWFCCQKVIK